MSGLRSSRPSELWKAGPLASVSSLVEGVGDVLSRFYVQSTQPRVRTQRKANKVGQSEGSRSLGQEQVVLGPVGTPKGPEKLKTLIMGMGSPRGRSDVGRLGRSECLVTTCTGPSPADRMTWRPKACPGLPRRRKGDGKPSWPRSLQSGERGVSEESGEFWSKSHGILPGIVHFCPGASAQGRSQFPASPTRIRGEVSGTSHYFLFSPRMLDVRPFSVAQTRSLRPSGRSKSTCHRSSMKTAKWLLLVLSMGLCCGNPRLQCSQTPLGLAPPSTSTSATVHFQNIQLTDEFQSHYRKCVHKNTTRNQT